MYIKQIFFNLSQQTFAEHLTTHITCYAEVHWYTRDKDKENPQSLKKYSLSIFFVPRTVITTHDTQMSKNTYSLCSHRVHSLAEKLNQITT